MARALLVHLGAGALPAVTPAIEVGASWMPVVYVPPALPVPAGLTVTGILGGVRVKWNAVSTKNATYELQRADDDGGAPGDPVTLQIGGNREFSRGEDLKSWWRVRTLRYGVASNWSAWVSGLPITAEDIVNGQLAGNGLNRLWDEYTRFPGGSLPPFSHSATSLTAIADPDAIEGYALRAVTNGTSPTSSVAYFGTSSTDYNLPLKSGKFIVSWYAVAGTPGHLMRFSIKGSDGTVYQGADVAIQSAGLYQRYSAVIDMSAFLGGAGVLLAYFNRSGVDAVAVRIFGVMVESTASKTTPSAWTPGSAGRQALLALNNAAVAQATADGKITLFAQDNPPTIGSGAGQAKPGDIWKDTNDGNKEYTVQGGSWVYTGDSRLAASILAAAGAQATADSKIQCFYSTSTPTATGVGDLWVNSSQKVTSRWNGSSWVKVAADGDDDLLVPNGSFAREFFGWGNLVGTGAIQFGEDADGFYLRQDGTAASSDLSQANYIPVEVGDRFKVSATFERAGSTPDGLVGFTRRTFDDVKAQVSYANFQNWDTSSITSFNPTKFEAIYQVTSGISFVKFGLYFRNRSTGSYYVRNYKVERLPKNIEDIAFSSNYGYPALNDLYNTGGLYRIGLRYGASGHRLGDARNVMNGLAAGFGSVASTSTLTATNAGVINVKAFTMRYGGVSVSYSAVNNAITGLTVGTTYIVYCEDDNYAGGSRTWHATTNASTAQNAGSGVVIAGAITIPNTGTGGSSDPGDPTCPEVDQLLPDGRRVGDLKVGDLVPCWNMDSENPAILWKPVRAIHISTAECASLHFSNGAEVRQSLTTPMHVRGGQVFRTLETYGKQILTQIGARLVWGRCDRVLLRGRRLVAKVDVDDSVFLCGVDAKRTVATHNIRYKP